MRQNRFCAILDLNERYQALMPLTQFRPVGTLPFAGRYRLVDFPLSSVSNAGIRDVGMYLPKSGRSVQDHIRSGASWNMDTITGGIFYFPYIEDKDYEDPTNQARYYDDYLTFLRNSDSLFTVVMGAKNVENINLQEVLQFHLEGNRPLTVLYKRQDPSQVKDFEDTLNISEAGDVTAILKAEQITPDPVNHQLPMDMGVYLLRTSFLVELIQNTAQRNGMVRLYDILHEAVEMYNANAYEYTGFYANINSMQRYFDTNMAMLEEQNYQALLYSQRHIFTKNKNEIPTFFAKSSEVSTSLLGTGCRIEGRVDHSVLFRSATVNRGAVVDQSIIMQGAKVGPQSHLKYVILDKGVVIGSGLNIEGTPEAPLVFAKNSSVLHEADIQKGVQNP